MTCTGCHRPLECRDRITYGGSLCEDCWAESSAYVRVPSVPPRDARPVSERGFRFQTSAELRKRAGKR